MAEMDCVVIIMNIRMMANMFLLADKVHYAVMCIMSKVSFGQQIMQSLHWHLILYYHVIYIICCML